MSYVQCQRPWHILYNSNGLWFRRILREEQGKKKKKKLKWWQSLSNKALFCSGNQCSLRFGKFGFLLSWFMVNAKDINKWHLLMKINRSLHSFLKSRTRGHWQISQRGQKTNSDLNLTAWGWSQVDLVYLIHTEERSLWSRHH